MTVALYTKGGASASNIDVPTNGKITANNTYTVDGTRLFTAIHPDAHETGSSDSHTYELVSGATEISNLVTTKGYRIKTFQTATQTGYLFNPSDWDDTNKKFDNFDYFVLVYSDDHLQHHFAKITEVIKEDVLGDAFEFSPKLGNEIPKDTKFMIIKGPPQDSSVVAFSAGIKKDLQNELVCAEPLFYFYNEKLDKKGELDHNKKYFIRQHGISSGTTVTMHGNADDATFLTTQEYLGEIVDYSRYSMKVTITDNLRDLDVASGGSNEGETITGYGTNSNYGDIFVNARRDTNDQFNSNYAGKYRYLSYSYSPNCTNILSNVIKNTVNQSFNNITGRCESTIVDTFRISNVKLKENDFYGVRHRVHVGETQDWTTIDCNITTLDSSSGYMVVTVDINDIESYLVAGNEIKIENTIVIVRSVSNSASTSTITLENFYRATTDGEFSSGTPTLTTDDTIYRRAFNHLNSTLLTDFKIIEGREEDLYIRFDAHNFALLEAKVSSTSKNQKLLTLTTEFESYDTTPLAYLNGPYSIEINRFEGEIETITTYKENGQTYVDISGRDKFNKILSPIINKETVFSEDIVYSSESPYPELFPFTSTSGGYHISLTSATFDSDDLQFDRAVTVVVQNADPSSAQLDSKTHLYAKLGEHICFVGRVNESSGTFLAGSNVRVSKSSYVELLSGDSALLYYSRLNNKIIFNKALSSNSAIDSASDLRGASDKGVLFTGGYSIDQYGDAEGDYLPNTSSNTTNALARGYYISKVQNMKNDSYFFANIGNDATPEEYEDFNIINSLLDFTVVAVKDNGALKEIEIAPHNPLLLARKDINLANAISEELTSTDEFSITIGNMFVEVEIGEIFIIIDNNSLSNTNANRYAHEGSAIYSNGIFLGIIDVSYPQSAFATSIRLKAPAPISVSTTDTITIIGKTTQGDYDELNKKSHEFSIINGGILHGGKMISLLSPFMGNFGHSEGASVLDYMTYQTTSANRISYKERFGSPIYRIFNVEKGNILRKNHNYINQPEILNFYDKNSDISYYGSGYKNENGFFYDGGTYYDNLLGANRKITARPNPEIEVRGITSVMGSKFYDANILPSGQNPIPIIHEKQNVGFYDNMEESNIAIDSPTVYYRSQYAISEVKAKLDVRDTTADRMFIYSISDLYPYSRQQSTALLKTGFTRTIKNYGIISLDEPLIDSSAETKDNLGINTSRVNYQDKDYKIAFIHDHNKEINSLKVFSIMRLTEVVLDFGFNSINIEQEQPKTRTIPPMAMPYGKLESNIDGTNTLTLVDGSSNDYSSFTSPYTIAVTTDYTAGSNPLIAGDMLTTTNGLVIGEVTGVTASTITLREIHLVEKGSAYYGDVYAFKAKDVANAPYITGTGGSDNLGQAKKSISLSKTIATSHLSTEMNRFSYRISLKIGRFATSTKLAGGYIQLVIPNSNTATTASDKQIYRFGFDPLGTIFPTLAGAVDVDLGVGSFDWLSSSMNENIMEKLFDAMKTTDIFDYVYIQKQGPTILQLNAIHVDNASPISECSSLTFGGSSPYTPFSDNVKTTLIANAPDILKGGYGGSIGGSDSVFEKQDSDDRTTSFGSRLGSTIVANRLASSLFPFFTTWGYQGGAGSFTVSSFENSYDKHTPSHLFKQLFMCNEIGDADLGSLTHDNELFMENFLPIALGTFSAEEDTGYKLDYGTVGTAITGVSRIEYTTSEELMAFGISQKGGMGSLLSHTLGDLNPDEEAIGVQYGFKPRLDMLDAQTNAYHVTNSPEGYQTSRAVGGETVYHYTIDSAEGTNGATNNGNKYKWLELFDLTGCYLASYQGYHVDEDGVSKLRGKKHTRSMNNMMPYKLIYVISHELDTSSTEIRHIVTTDEKLDTETYVILQPNHVCFHENSNKNIYLNTLSSNYTINPITNKPFKDLKSYSVKDKIATDKQGDNEAALSMYVLVDNNSLHYDNASITFGPYNTSKRYQKHLVVRDVQTFSTTGGRETKLDDILNDIPTSMVFSDGDEFVKSSIQYNKVLQDADSSSDEHIRHNLVLSDMKKLKGIVSVSETITLQVSNNFSSNAKRCMIGTTVYICNETNDLINNLLEEEGIDFQITTEDDYPLFVAPDIRGKSLLDSLNLLLNKKDKTILYYDNKFIIRDKKNSDNYPQILLSEDSDINIYEYERDKNMFDIYNEIIVYGANHRAIRRNIRSQNKIGRKTLEHFSDELTTQQEVDAKAIELLKIHSELSSTFKFKIGHNNVSQIRAGDIITISLPRENIHTNQYIVLEIQHTIDGLIELKVGKYSKEIADRFIELLLETKKQTNYLKRKNFIDRTQNFTTIDVLNINLLKLKIRKSTGTGFTLGFGQQLNTGTNSGQYPLGFAGGNFTFTTLLEEEY